ncbi:MAG: PilZ domain-containing protein [Spirochaetota bacterium]
MSSLAIIIVVALVLALVTLALFVKGGKRMSIFEFMAKALQNGLSPMEAGRLHEAAVSANLEDPGKLFFSALELDRAIAAIGGSDVERSKELSGLLDKLYGMRKRLEFEKPRYQKGVKSTRQMPLGQRMRILVEGLGVFHATVVSNNQRFLVVSWPVGVRLPAGFLWNGRKVSVYFWRRDDAGYVFDSFVLDDLRMGGVPVIHIAHSESLLRTQKRKSVRAKTTIPAYLYILKRIEGAFEKPELQPGYRARLADLSEDGFAIAIGGKAKEGLLVKAQFALGSRQIVMSGTVKSIDFNRDANQSTLHILAVPPSPRTRNAIRTFVYGANAVTKNPQTEAEG